MSLINPEISLITIKEELDACKASIEEFGWKISDIDIQDLSFNVEMSSKVDKELYILKIQFDDYPSMPLLMDFINPDTGLIGVNNAYPLGKDSFFNTTPCICNPFSRKAYKELGGPHGDWSQIGWKSNPQATLKDLHSILYSIQSRINDSSTYRGRMK